MTLENRSVNDRVAEIAADSCVALWEAYGVRLTPVEFRAEELPSTPMLFGAIGFVGDTLRATCLLGADEVLIEASGRAGCEARDWIAELSNQLIGRIKMRLFACGVQVKLTTPLALSGIKLRPLPRHAGSPLAFQAARGRVIVWLELESQPGLQLSSERPLSVTPGSLVF